MTVTTITETSRHLTHQPTPVAAAFCASTDIFLPDRTIRSGLLFSECTSRAISSG